MSALPEHILLSAEAKRRGFKTTRSLRAWCVTNGVVIAKTGRKEWVKPADIDAALQRAFSTTPANSVVQNVVDRFTRKVG